MADSVLVAYDGTDQAEAALEYAFDQHADADLTVLTVIDPGDVDLSAGAALPDFPEEWFETRREEVDELHDAVRDRAAEHGIEVATETEVGRPARTIVEYADDHDVDHIVLGSHGRSGVTRILLGSVAESVIRRSSMPVTVVR